MSTALSSRAGSFLRCFSIYLAAFAAVIIWLPLVRGVFDGASYHWGLAYFGRQFGGSGVDGDYWLIVAQATWMLALVYLGLRRPGALSYTLLLAWHGANAVSWGMGYLADPADMVLQGDTLAVSINIGLVAAGLFVAGLAAALASLMLEISDDKTPPRFAWTRANSIALGLALALLPLQFCLLRLGEAHGATDADGVLLTMLQWLMLVVAFGLDRKRPSAPVRLAVS